jgi:glycosyltransferase involved in cell wall biosynthesis
VGVILKKLTGTRLVSMFEDPWLGMHHRVWHSDAQRRLQERQEYGVLHNSDLILTATDGLREDLLTRYGDDFRKKIVTLRMGDMGIRRHSDQTPTRPARSAGDAIRLVYAGSLRRSPQYDATALLQAFASLQHRDPKLAERLTLTVYGNTDAYYRQMSLDLGLDPAVDFAGFVSHEQAGAAMDSADGLVLLIGGASPALRMYTSGKLYEYMAARRPILALVPSDGEAASLVRRHRLGLVVPPDDPKAITDALVLFARERSALASQLGDTSQYTAHAIADQAVDIFDHVLPG